MKIKTIVFDFDGVIVLGSELAKHRAWLEMFAGQGESVAALVVTAREKFSLGRGSRFDILADVFTQLGHTEQDIPKLVNDYAERYNQTVLWAILSEGVLIRDRKFLNGLSPKLPLYLSTATPQEAIDNIISLLDLNQIFKTVYGAPNNKLETLKAIAQHETITPEHMLFVGDGEGDYKAAQDFACHFVGITNEHNHWLQKDFDFPVISNIAELANVVEL